MDKSVSNQVYMKDNHYVDEGYCHDNDLVLAAELGKALLERNRYLEDALEKAKNAEDEKNSEIKFLQSQVSELRKFSTERADLVDEAERFYQELEIKNYQLLQEKMVDSERIHRLSTRVRQLEEQVLQLTEEASDDGQPPNSSCPSGRSRSSGNPSAGCRRLANHPRRCQRDVRSGFIDDELFDQPELLGVATRTDTMSWQHLNRLVPRGMDRQSRTFAADTNGTVSRIRLPRFSSHPPTASRCYHTESGTIRSTSHHDPGTGPLLSESASSFCPHGLRVNSSTCSECFDSSREMKELKALLHGAAVMRELDRIYDAQLQCQLSALRATDQPPAYRQLFAEAFQMVTKLRQQAAE